MVDIYVCSSYASGREAAKKLYLVDCPLRGGGGKGLPNKEKIPFFLLFYFIFARSFDHYADKILRLPLKNPTLVKSKNENHQNSMYGSSKEPHWLTDHKSEEKLKKDWLDEWQENSFFFNENSQSLFFCKQTSQILFFLSFSLQIGDQWIHTVLLSYRTLNLILIFWLYKGGILKNQNQNEIKQKSWQFYFSFFSKNMIFLPIFAK